MAAKVTLNGDSHSCPNTEGFNTCDKPEKRPAGIFSGHSVTGKTAENVSADSIGQIAPKLQPAEAKIAVGLQSPVPTKGTAYGRLASKLKLVQGGNVEAAAKAKDPPYVPGKKYQVTVLHMNDTHGHYWPNKKGEGGFPAVSTLVKQVRAEVEQRGGHVLFLSAGDVNTGSPRSDLMHAEPDIEAMNAMGVAAMSLGNHEFDNPTEVLRKQQQIAEFPILGANVYHKGSTQRAFDSHTI